MVFLESDKTANDWSMIAKIMNKSQDIEIAPQGKSGGEHLEVFAIMYCANITVYTSERRG